MFLFFDDVFVTFLKKNMCLQRKPVSFSWAVLLKFPNNLIDKVHYVLNWICIKFIIWMLMYLESNNIHPILKHTNCIYEPNCNSLYDVTFVKKTVSLNVFYSCGSTVIVLCKNSHFGVNHEDYSLLSLFTCIYI